MEGTNRFERYESSCPDLRMAFRRASTTILALLHRRLRSTHPSRLYVFVTIRVILSDRYRQNENPRSFRGERRNNRFPQVSWLRDLLRTIRNWRSVRKLTPCEPPITSERRSSRNLLSVPAIRRRHDVVMWYEIHLGGAGFSPQRQAKISTTNVPHLIS